MLYSRSHYITQHPESRSLVPDICFLHSSLQERGQYVFLGGQKEAINCIVVDVVARFIFMLGV